MFNRKDWIMKYFRGGWLATVNNLTKKEALSLMNSHIDGHCIEKIKGFGKGKVIYKFPRKVTK